MEIIYAELALDIEGDGVLVRRVLDRKEAYD
jgi:hypothetical protein